MRPRESGALVSVALKQDCLARRLSTGRMTLFRRDAGTGRYRDDDAKDGRAVIRAVTAAVGDSLRVGCLVLGQAVCLDDTEGISCRAGMGHDRVGNLFPNFSASGSVQPPTRRDCDAGH